MKVIAPGKLILSGEHAVVYGNPALAMAVDRYVSVTVTRESRPQILFDLSDLAHRSRMSLRALRQLKQRIKLNYHRFIRGDIGIRDVLIQPSELAQFALSVFADSFQFTLPNGFKLQIESDIPIGCGMGSSAATILCVMKAMSRYLNMTLSPEQLYPVALNAENMQHGRSSGLDIRVSLQGGCVYLHDQKIESRVSPTLPLYLVNTGTPLTSTGQCVEKVAPLFQSAALKESFAEVTLAMDAALQQSDWQSFRQAMRQNQVLLQRIGVVPDRVQQCIAQIESAGGSAKVCGAGAVAGDHAGAVLVSADDMTPIHAICERYGFIASPVSCVSRGVHAL